MIIYYSREFSGGRPESRRLLEKAFAKHLGDPALAGDLVKRIKTGEQGKPYIDGFSPFSVSHTGSLWAVLIADRECGLDIQFTKGCNMQAMADRVYAPEDREVLSEAMKSGGQSVQQGADGSAAADVFFRIWTRREALVKALGDSVVRSDLPPVLRDHVIISGEKEESCESETEQTVWTLADIPAEEEIFPGTDEIDTRAGKLYAAVCIEGSSAIQTCSTDDDRIDPLKNLIWELI